VLVFQVKLAFIACDDVAEMCLLHGLQQAKKLAAFRDPHLPQVVCQLVWDPAEMNIFITI
jgi:hypothetical protein